jgi:Reverse transcriptase (RNA-dependent DNA polymerase)
MVAGTFVIRLGIRIEVGFKKHLSCNDVIFRVRNVVAYYVANGSTVIICSLDLSQAFDTMNHYVLLIKLISEKLLLQLLDTFELWFKTSKTCVKWEGYFSRFFQPPAGVGQGVLSPLCLPFLSMTFSIRSGAQTSVAMSILLVAPFSYIYADDIVWRAF